MGRSTCVPVCTLQSITPWARVFDFGNGAAQDNIVLSLNADRPYFVLDTYHGSDLKRVDVHRCPYARSDLVYRGGDDRHAAAPLGKLPAPSPFTVSCVGLVRCTCRGRLYARITTSGTATGLLTSPCTEMSRTSCSPCARKGARGIPARWCVCEPHGHTHPRASGEAGQHVFISWGLRSEVQK